MTTIAQAVARALQSLPVAVQEGPLAATAIRLAERLDAPETTDRDIAALSRELRLVLAELHGQAGSAAKDVEEFLARISAPDLSTGAL